MRTSYFSVPRRRLAFARAYGRPFRPRLPPPPPLPAGFRGAPPGRPQHQSPLKKTSAKESRKVGEPAVEDRNSAISTPLPPALLPVHRSYRVDTSVPSSGPQGSIAGTLEHVQPIEVEVQKRQRCAPTVMAGVVVGHEATLSINSSRLGSRIGRQWTSTVPPLPRTRGFSASMVHRLEHRRGSGLKKDSRSHRTVPSTVS